MIRNFRPSRIHLALAAIVLVALGLRLWGIGFGLPFEFHVDEVQYVRQAATMGENGLRPVWWNNPPLLKYILLAEYGLMYLVGKVFGLYTSVGDFGLENTFNPTNLYLIGRATSALFGTLTVLVVYWLGRAAYSKTVGLLAATFLAVAFLHVRDSHYAVNDVAATFFVTLALLGAVMTIKSDSLKWYILSGIAVGLGFATKYSAAIVVLPIAIAHFTAPSINFRDLRSLNLRPLVLFIAICILVAVLASPFFILDFQRVISDINSSLFQAGQTGFDGWEIDPDGSFLYYVKTLIWGLGIGLFVASLAGVLFAVIRHKRADLILVSLPTTFLLIAGVQEMYFARFILPILPALLVLAGLVTAVLAAQVTKNQRYARLVLASIALIFLIQPLATSVRHDYLLTLTDTRALSKTWIESNIPSGARIAVDWPFHGPPLSTYDKEIPQSQELYYVTIAGGHGLSDKTLSWYRNEDFDYIIASSFIWEIELSDEEANFQRNEFYGSLDDELDCLKQFNPHDGNGSSNQIFDEIYGPATSVWQRLRPGPVIRICRIV